MLNIWIRAARLRTLPLSVSGVILGGAAAASEGAFRPAVFALSVLTALLLQILSNFANDYGDYTHGTDGAAVSGRAGPFPPEIFLRVRCSGLFCCFPA